MAAAVEAVDEVGYDRLSMRDVSRRAGVTHATTYGYFSSKQHVIAEAFVRELVLWGELPIEGESPVSRLDSVFRAFGQVLVRNPSLSRASTAALLGEDDVVRALRLRAGEVIVTRLAAALGDAASNKRVDALVLAINGATLQAGLGYSTFGEVPQRLAAAASFIMADLGCR